MAGFKQKGLGYGTYYSSQPNNSSSMVRRLLIIGVIVAILISAGLFILNMLSGNAKNDLTLLAVRENSLLVLANASGKNIRDPDLNTVNSNATVLLTSDVASIVSDTGIKKLPDDLVKKEADTHTEDLKQAVLLNKFDTTYRQLVIEKVEALISQAQMVHDSLSSRKSRDVVDKALINLRSIQKQFTDLRL